MEKLIDNNKAAALLGISPFSLRRKVAQRAVPHLKIERRTLFSPTDLQAFIESQKVQPRPRREAQ
jgi:hypothetical protein